jgi:hypothetical protein
MWLFCHIAMRSHFVQPDRAPRTALFAVAAALALTLFGSVASQAALRDSFEGPVPSWQPTGVADARHRIDHHARVRGSAHSGQWCERIRLSAGNGSHVHMRHSIGRALVIKELKPSVWVQSDRPGIQILANVVLPHTTDAESGKPMSLLLGGTIYNRAGSWQQLAVSDMPTLLTRQIRVLRSQLGAHVDPREAYVDHVILNVYGGRGTTNVLVDDLEVHGIVSRGPSTPSVELHPPITSRLPMARRQAGQPRFRMDGAVLRYGNQPVLVRMIEHHGEPLAWLRSLGFNAVRLRAAPSAELLAESRRSGMWLVCPPPTQRKPNNQITVAPIDPSYDGVLAWNLGSGLIAQHRPQVESLARQLRSTDTAVRRPIVCQASSSLAEYSRLADVLMLHREPLGTSLELVDYEVWLRARQQLARAGTMFWAEIQTQHSAALTQQLRWMTGGRVQAAPIDQAQIRTLIAMALSSGVRGFCFLSNARLDGKDAASRHRAMSLELINMQLELFESSVTEGGVAVHAPSSDRGLSAAVLGHPHKSMRLILPIRRSSGEQIVGSRPQTEGISVTVPGVPESNQAYRVSPVGLDTLQRRRLAGGLRISLDRHTSDMPVLLTDDALVVQRLTEQLRRHSGRAAQLENELAKLCVLSFEASHPELTGTGAQSSREVAEYDAALKSLTASSAALAAKDHKKSYQQARQTTDTLGTMNRRVWQNIVRHSDSAVSMPLAMTEATLADAARHLPQVANAPLSANVLPAGDFKNLSTLMAAGWRHYRQTNVKAMSAVELVPAPGSRPGTCMLLRAAPTETEIAPRLVETPPVWITSPTVQVTQGQLVRIEGEIYIPHAITGSVDGLLIAESIGGEPLAYRAGVTQGWQRFTLYRVATRTAPLSVTIALTGHGEAWIDDITIRTVGQ